MYACVNIQAQGRLDSTRIENAQLFISSFSLLPPDYFVAIYQHWYLMVYPCENKYYMESYEKKYSYGEQIEFYDFHFRKKVKWEKKLSMQKIFNSDTVCINSYSFAPDSIVQKLEIPYVFLYFVQYKDGLKICEFNYPLFQKIVNYTPLDKNIF